MFNVFTKEKRRRKCSACLLPAEEIVSSGLPAKQNINMDRSPWCSKKGLNRANWTRKEDMLLSEYIRINGENGRWTNLPKKLGLQRTGKSCRLRWLNYLRPDIKRGSISPDEDELIIRLHRLLGNRWSLIAGRLPGRTGNEIKNYWNTHLSKKLLSMDNSQTNSRVQYLKTRSKPPHSLQNHVFKTTPVRITRAVKHAESGYGSHEAYKLCNVKETPNSNSMSWCDLPLSDSITDNHSERISFGMADVNIVKAQGRNSTSTMSSLVDEESPNSDNLGDTGTLHENLQDFNGPSCPRWNLLFSASDYSTDFGVNELDRGAVMEMNEFEDNMFSGKRYMQSANRFAVAYHEGMEGFDNHTEHVNWIPELDYLNDLDS